MPVTTSRTNHRLSTPSAASASDCQTPGQIRMAIDSVLEYEVDDTSEFVFQIHVSDMPGQTLIVESLLVEPRMPYRCYTDTASGKQKPENSRWCTAPLSIARSNPWPGTHQRCRYTTFPLMCCIT